MSSTKSRRLTQTRDREKQALDLRRTGQTYQQVADALGYGNASNAHRAVFRALDRIPVDSVQQLRRIENERLDALHAAHWALALAGSASSARIIIQVMERRARLLGLDAPSLAPDSEELDAEIEALIATLSNDGAWNTTGIPDDTGCDPPACHC